MVSRAQTLCKLTPSALFLQQQRYVEPIQGVSLTALMCTASTAKTVTNYIHQQAMRRQLTTMI